MSGAGVGPRAERPPLAEAQPGRRRRGPTVPAHVEGGRLGPGRSSRVQGDGAAVGGAGRAHLAQRRLGTEGREAAAVVLHDPSAREQDLDGSAPTLGTLGMQLVLAVMGLCSSIASVAALKSATLSGAKVSS